MAVLVGDQVRIAAWMALRSAICLHIKVPAFNRQKVMAACRSNGFTGRTLKQARVWIDERCDALGIPRDAGIPKDAVRHAVPES